MNRVDALHGSAAALSFLVLALAYLALTPADIPPVSLAAVALVVGVAGALVTRLAARITGNERV